MYYTSNTYQKNDLFFLGESREKVKSDSKFFAYSYRFGFNGQEKTNEIAGIGNHNTATFWEYDTRLGRRWNVDPVDQVSISNYAVLGNNPMVNTDVLGNQYTVTNKTNDKGKLTETTISATVYITGKGASANKAEQLNEKAKSVFKNQNVDGVQVNFNINYVFANDKQRSDLKVGENIIEFTNDKDAGDAFMFGLPRDKNVQQVSPKAKVFSGSNTLTYDVMHETGHLIGLSDRYDNDKDFGTYTADVPHKGYENDLMGSEGKMKLHINHYKNIIEYANYNLQKNKPVNVPLDSKWILDIKYKKLSDNVYEKNGLKR